MGRCIEYVDFDPTWLDRVEADPSCLPPGGAREWVKGIRSLLQCHALKPDLARRLAEAALGWLGVADPAKELTDSLAGEGSTGTVATVLYLEASKVQEAVERFKTLAGVLAHAAELLPDVPTRV